MQELKPCPFCGRSMRERDVTLVSFGIGVIGAEVACHCGCVMYLGDFKTGEEARAEAIKKWNTRAEPEPEGGTGLFDGACAVCGGYLEEEHNYCSNCGAKVVE